MSGPTTIDPTLPRGARLNMYPRQTPAQRDAEIIATLIAAWKDYDAAS